MKFLVDAQLPRLLAIRLKELGHSALHTLELASANRTPDNEIASTADQEQAVVITKDADFLDSHLISGCPSKLLLVSAGNISNRELLRRFEIHIVLIASSLEQSDFVELNQLGLVIHD